MPFVTLFYIKKKKNRKNTLQIVYNYLYTLSSDRTRRPDGQTKFGSPAHPLNVTSCLHGKTVHSWSPWSPWQGVVWRCEGIQDRRVLSLHGVYLIYSLSIKLPELLD